MNTEQLAFMIQIAGVLHAGLIAAGLLMPRAVGLRQHLATLPAFVRRLFWVYYIFIGFSLVSFGLVSLTMAGTLASGSGLARVVCGFLAIFWTIRLFAALFIFDVRPYLTNNFWRVSYALTNVVFACLPVIYAIACFKPGTQ